MGSSNRKTYETATVLDQAFLDECHDNQACKLEMIAEISLPTGSSFLTDKLYLSDRNKYVGEHYYEARINFPPIIRTIGELLSPVIEFSSLKLEINNADGRFNSILPGGADYGGFVNQRVVIKVGLRDVASTYKTIFDGFVTDIGGFERTVKSFSIVVRDRFDDLKKKFPTTTFTRTTYPDIADSVAGKIIPYILGDWTVALNLGSGASVPAYPINGAAAGVLAGTTNLDLVISYNTNRSFDSTKVVLQRGDKYYTFNSADIVNVNGNKNRFEIRQSGTGGVTTIEGTPFVFVDSDKIFVKVEGKSLDASRHDNAVEQAKDILVTFTSIGLGDFDSTWLSFATKASPAESAIANIKSRLWINTQKPALEIALSLLEQVRLEAFIDRNQLLKISSLHFDAWDDDPDFVVRNWDIKRDSFQPKLDTRTNVNRLKGFFNYLPDLNENYAETNFFINQDSIDQNDKTIEKGLPFPNLYVESDVANQIKELLKITSGFVEYVNDSQTWRSLLLDIGDFVKMDVQIGSVIFQSVPCMIRDLGYSARGLEIIVKYLSCQLLPFKTWAGVGSGIVAGSSATITEQTS